MASKSFQHRESLNFIIQMLTGWHRCLATTNLFPMPRSSSRIRTTRPTSRTLSSGDSAKRNRPQSQDTKTRVFLAEIFLLSISERARYHLLDKSIICGLFLALRIQFKAYWLDLMLQLVGMRWMVVTGCGKIENSSWRWYYRLVFREVYPWNENQFVNRANLFLIVVRSSLMLVVK